MFEWDESYSVGVSKIDEEHQKLIEIINKVDIARQGNHTGKALEALQEMTIYALIHFGTEESYMEKFKYSEYESHKNDHHDFSIKTGGYYKKITEDYTQTVEDMIDFLQGWLVDHIQGTDKKYTSCFNENGLK